MTVALFRSVFTVSLLMTVVMSTGCRPRSSPATATISGPTEVRRSPSADGAGAGAPAGVLAEVTSVVSRQRQLELRESLDPRRDGWTSEAIAERLTRQLTRITDWIQSRSVRFPLADECLAPDCTVQRLIPAALRQAFHDQVVTVRRAEPDRAPAMESLEESAARLVARFRETSDWRIDLKVVRVSSTASHVTADLMYQSSGRNSTGRIQHQATWHTTWRIDSIRDRLLLERVEVIDFEETETWLATNEQRAWLLDCTEDVFAGDQAFQDQLRYGANEWMRRIPAYLSPRLLEGHIGLALGDINADGLDDLYVCQPGGLPNRLYVQNVDGTLRDISRSAGVDLLDWTYSALILDLNNDSHQDLALLADTRLLIFAGDGQGRFQLRTALESSCEYALSAADFDADGDLDLYACNYYAEVSGELAQLRRSDPLYDSNTGGRNVLYENQGQFTFRDVTDAVGLDVNNRRWSLAAAWEDYDNDGDQDLYVVNDFGRNNLYRNLGGRFEEVAGATGTEDANQGMSVSWSDFDHDGRMDLYVSNMFSAAGNRVTNQPDFMPGVSDDTKRRYQILARGNTLLNNQPDGTFRDVSEERGVTMGRWAWASLFVDLNNDSWDDLLVTNGYLTQKSADDL